MSPKGLPDLTGPDGHVELPTDLEPWAVEGPIVLDGGSLMRRFDPLRGLGLGDSDDWEAQVHPAEGLLEGFIALTDAPDRTIVRYANRWGLLGLCPHGLPADHEQLIPSDLLGDDGCFGPLDSEPVDWWRHWASHLGAVTGLIARGQQSEPGRASDWSMVWEPPPWLLRSRWGTFGLSQAANNRSRIEAARRGGSERSSATAWRGQRRPFPSDAAGSLSVESGFLVWEINRWLTYGGVRLVLDLATSGPRIVYRGNGLVGALAVQLMLALVGRGMVVCSNCGRPFSPSKRRNPNRRIWCGRDECRRASHAHAQARHRSGESKPRQPR